MSPTTGVLAFPGASPPGFTKSRGKSTRRVRFSTLLSRVENSKTAGEIKSAVEELRQLFENMAFELENGSGERAGKQLDVKENVHQNGQIVQHMNGAFHSEKKIKDTHIDAHMEHLLSPTRIPDSEASLFSDEHEPNEGGLQIPELSQVASRDPSPRRAVSSHDEEMFNIFPESPVGNIQFSKRASWPSGSEFVTSEHWTSQRRMYPFQRQKSDPGPGRVNSNSPPPQKRHELKTIPEHLQNKRLRGKALWFANKLGFGFIHAEGHDFFVHHSDIKMTGWRSLTPGVPVEFELREDKGRVKAVEVTAPATGPRKTEQRTIKICAADLKGACHRGAHCRFAHVADVATRGSVVKRASLGDYSQLVKGAGPQGGVDIPWGHFESRNFTEELRGY